MKRRRIILADDHKIFAAGLKRLLEPEFEVVRIVEDGRSLVSSVKELRPDVAVVDNSMPGLNGIEAARRIIDTSPATKVVVLTMHEDVSYATTALDDGVHGYVLKNSDPSELLMAIREALRGRTFVAPAIADAVFRSQRRRSRREEPKLTSRQREILVLRLRVQQEVDPGPGLRVVVLRHAEGRLALLHSPQIGPPLPVLQP